MDEWMYAWMDARMDGCVGGRIDRRTDVCIGGWMDGWTDGLMGGGNGEAIFRDFLIQEYGKAASKAGGIGLAKSIVRQLSTMQEVKND